MGPGQIVPVVSPRGLKTIEREAERFLAAHFPDLLVRPQPLDVIELFEGVVEDSYGYEALVKPVVNQLEGWLDPDNEQFVLTETTYEEARLGLGRARFSIAHETGHLVLHAREIKGAGTKLVEGLQVQLARRGELKAYLDPEWQANQFAAALLMPAPAMRILARPGLGIGDIERTFMVSRTAASKRLRQFWEGKL